jgi:hypothetical protein
MLPFQDTSFAHIARLLLSDVQVFTYNTTRQYMERHVEHVHIGDGQILLYLYVLVIFNLHKMFPHPSPHHRPL